MAELTPQHAAPKPWPWARIVLVLSLGLNLLFLGAIGGAFLRQGPPGRGAIIRDVNFGPLTEALSKADREALRQQFQNSGPDPRSQRGDIEGDLAQLSAILRAPDFQRGHVEALFARQNERALVRQNLGQNMILDLLDKMGPGERSAFADRLETVLKLGRKPRDP